MKPVSKGGILNANTTPPLSYLTLHDDYPPAGRCCVNTVPGVSFKCNPGAPKFDPILREYSLGRLRYCSTLFYPDDAHNNADNFEAGNDFRNHARETIRSFNLCLREESTTNGATEITANKVIKDAPGVGSWGGKCICPDGSEYFVGDNLNLCSKDWASISCVGGIYKAEDCTKADGPWAGRKVVCSNGAGAKSNNNSTNLSN